MVNIFCLHHVLMLPVLLPWLHQKLCGMYINQGIMYTDSQCRCPGLVGSRASMKRRKPCRPRMLSGIGCIPAGLRALRLELSSRCFDLFSVLCHIISTASLSCLAPLHDVWTMHC